MADNQRSSIGGWHWVAYALIITVLIILAANGFLFIFWNHITDPRVFIAITLMSLFVLTTTTTLAIIFLWGAGVLTFDKDFVHWLGGATVAEVAGILIIIVNFYFNGQNPKMPAQTQTPTVQQTQPATFDPNAPYQTAPPSAAAQGAGKN
jgi:hypothetical protein